MDSPLVIKVKYGDTLRRFTSYVDDNGLMDLDMGGLRAKILGLFKLPPDADITLTYNDEDNDVVTLVDDDDLRDATLQCLNPLRINVRLNNGRAGRSDLRSSGSSTPMKSPQIQHSVSAISSGISEALKSVPEPFRDPLSKLSHDLTSKAASSAPALTELMERLSKLGQFYLGPVSQSQAGSNSSSQTGAYEGPMDFKVTDDKDTSKDKLEGLKVLSNDQLVTPASNQKELVSEISSRGIGTAVVPTTATVDLNLNLPEGSVASAGFSAFDLSVLPVFSSNVTPNDNWKNIEKVSDGHLSGDSHAPGSSTSSPPTNLKLLTSQADKNVPHDIWLGTLGADNQNQLLSGIGCSSASQIGFLPLDISVNDQIGADGSDVVPSGGVPSGGYHRVHQFKRSHNHFDRMGRIFHRGIRCDGCGVYPITGPRYKSKVKEDYDLCSICFIEMGDEAEYIKMDRPFAYQSSPFFRGSHDPHHRFQTPSLPHVLRGCGPKPCRPRLDSRFIQDVNVMDGTPMAPATPFTKIWRMRNNGNVIWPHGTQLVWIGGDRFTDIVSVDIEIPVGGCPVNMELDISVDFTAPERPGRYISYWRMASPSGQKFGQRVWVLIQVDASLKDSLSDCYGLNLNLPPQSSMAKGLETIDVNVEPVDDGLPIFSESVATELVKPVVDEQPNKNEVLNFPGSDGLPVGPGTPLPVSSELLARVSCPSTDFPVVPSEPLVADVPTLSGLNAGNTVEQTLLRDLEEMGFKQIDLNKEILRRNAYNMDQSLDDLCCVTEWGCVTEWDPMLEELQEMGFHDKETNKKLLIKNGGSIKRVVLDLIAGEKAE